MVNANRRSLLSSHAGTRGATLVEAAIAIPLLFGFVLVFFDAVSVGFNWVAMQRATLEGARYGATGRIETSPGVPETDAEYVTRVKQYVLGYAKSFDITSGGFLVMGPATLHNTDFDSINNISVEMVTDTFDLFSETGAQPEIIKVTITKQLSVTPVSAFFFSLARNPGGKELTLAVSAQSKMEVRFGP